ncbi:MAG: hypothetical protein ACW98Y_05955, partial [Candidatus Thorarchaeota archaeon]
MHLTNDQRIYLGLLSMPSIISNEMVDVYERYEPSDRIFVDREEYLDWMQGALKRCKEKSVVLHLRGIG